MYADNRRQLKVNEVENLNLLNWKNTTKYLLIRLKFIFYKKCFGVVIALQNCHKVDIEKFSALKKFQ